MHRKGSVLQEIVGSLRYMFYSGKPNIIVDKGLYVEASFRTFDHAGLLKNAIRNTYGIANGRSVPGSKVRERSFYLRVSRITEVGIVSHLSGYATVFSHAYGREMKSANGHWTDKLGWRYTLMSSPGYPNLSLINSRLDPVRASWLPKSPTYLVNVGRKVPRKAGDTRVGEAAISHEGQGVGTEPICVFAGKGCKE
jgi:hypothetical protein